MYDFEKDEIKLGVNVESAGEIKLKSTGLVMPPSLVQGEAQETADLIKSKPSTSISKSDEEWGDDAGPAKPSFDKVKNQEFEKEAKA